MTPTNAQTDCTQTLLQTDEGRGLAAIFVALPIAFISGLAAIALMGVATQGLPPVL